MAQQVGVLEIMLMANMAKLSQDMNAATKVVGDATGQMERHIASAKNAMSGLGMGVGLAAMTDQLRRATDAYVKLDAQVRINTKSQEQYNQALGDIRRIATLKEGEVAVGAGDLDVAVEPQQQPRHREDHDEQQDIWQPLDG